MNGLAPRFSSPVDVPRPRGSRLLEAFSPKLGRRVRLFDHAAFGQWIQLEADPSVLCLCERPQRLGVNGNGRLIDFWVERHDRAEMGVVVLFAPIDTPDFKKLNEIRKLREAARGTLT